MTPDELTAAGERLQDRAAHAVALLSRAEGLRSHSGEGRDATGAIVVGVDARGLPVRWRIASDWTRRLRAEEFDSAVLAACRAAAVDRTQRWSDQLDRYQVRATGRATSAPEPVADPSPGPTMASEPGRDAGVAVAALLDRLPGARPWLVEAREPVEVAGRIAGGYLSVWLTTDQLSGCRTDPRWVSEQSAARLTTALNDAVRDAREHLDAVDNRRRSTDSEAAAGLAADALSLLRTLGARHATPHRGPR